MKWPLSLGSMLLGAGLIAAACGDGPDVAPSVTAEPTPVPLPTVGDCLRDQPASVADIVPCDSTQARFRVLVIDRGSGERVCPPETDAGLGWPGGMASLCLKTLK